MFSRLRLLLNSDTYPIYDFRLTWARHAWKSRKGTRWVLHTLLLKTRPARWVTSSPGIPKLWPSRPCRWGPLYPSRASLWGLTYCIILENSPSLPFTLKESVVNRLRPRQNARHFLQMTFSNAFSWHLNNTSLKFVPEGPIWPCSLAHICVTRLKWVKTRVPFQYKIVLSFITIFTMQMSALVTGHNYFEMVFKT